MPGYVSRYDEYEADEFDLQYEGQAAGPPMSAGNEPPLRRGPLRGHTQHARGNQSVLRGPHVSARKESTTEGIGSDHHHIIAASRLLSAAVSEFQFPRTSVPTSCSLFPARAQQHHTRRHLHPQPSPDFSPIRPGASRFPPLRRVGILCLAWHEAQPIFLKTSILSLDRTARIRPNLERREPATSWRTPVRDRRTSASCSYPYQGLADASRSCRSGVLPWCSDRALLDSDSADLPGSQHPGRVGCRGPSAAGHRALEPHDHAGRTCRRLVRAGPCAGRTP